MEPLDILFINGLPNKPGLMGNSLFINITPIKEAFPVSKNHYVEIDLEKVSTGVNFTSIIETYFSKREHEYILGSQFEAVKGFFF